MHIAIILAVLISQILCLIDCKYENRGCNFHPSFWCSSRSIAIKCQVEAQCDKFVWSLDKDQADPVNLTLYYETLCPDCKDFTRQQLWPAFNKLGGIFNLELVPYGNANEQQVGDQWQFVCQHGPDECLGNLIQTCALHLEPNMKKTFPFIACMEFSNSKPNTSAPECARKLGVNLSSIMKCVNSPIGNQLEHKMALQTDALDPPHNFVPWITLNGEHTNDIQQKAETDLIQLICDTYQGPKPDICTEDNSIKGCSKE